MVDIPGNSSTTAGIVVGGTVTGSLEVVGDHDWFRITLEAGQTVTITLNGTTLEDPYLRIRNASGTLLDENDDISSGINRDSRLNFTASTSGTYYIDVGAWNEDYAGQYQLSVTTYVPPSVWTYDQIADQLTTGYWGGTAHRFNVSAGGQITVNLTALTADGRSLALAALSTWTDIIGVNFVTVTTGGQIVFDDNEEGAFAESSYSGSFITSSHVNVSTGWLSDYGTGLNTYSFQTYIHEVGHALGLGHAGNYNGEATYPYDASFLNDSWATTVMSYFSQTESTYFADLGFARNHVTTPMIADIAAMADLYGLSTTTRAGNTVYGAGWSNSMGALCLFDSGGVDTIDVSGIGGTNRIDLNPGTFSNILGEVGNLSIARGTIIENAIGGNGADVIIGNSAANDLYGNGGADTLDGGEGADRMIGGPGYDRYRVDNAGDRIGELVGEGTDTVYASVDYALRAGVAVEILRPLDPNATTALNFTGNEFAQSIFGNAGENKLVAAAGNDLLDGGAGADRLYGGLGNDAYFVDNVLDRPIEVVGEGTDTIFATVNYALRAGTSVEFLRTTNAYATTAINLTGNEFAQTIAGNAGANTLNGGAGDDTLFGEAGNDRLYGGADNDVLDGGTGLDRMAGGTGNDRYRVDNAGDKATEAVGEGTDTVYASVSYALNAGSEIEYLRASNPAATSALNLTGNEFAQTLVGNNGANVLDGGAGDDILIGGAGGDTFVFSNLGGTDAISDFGNGADKIHLVALDANANIAGDQAFNFVGDAAFTNTAGELRTYVTEGVHYVAGDVNGDGVADFIIALGASTVQSGDFLL